jgi:tetratricopeptide (TPR) repeat protein
VVAPPVETPPGQGLLRRLRAERRGPAPPPAPPGYEIVGELGRGGMGVVYVARQTALKRLVALKVIGAGAWAGPAEVARFRAEAEAVARLQHPNIVQIYEIGEIEGRPFFSLEFVEGGTLDRRLDGRPMSPRPAAELVRTLALAIHAAHQRGIVHRDLKPANILLSFSRETPASASPEALAGVSRLNEALPKIADFGLAKRLGGEPGMTQTGMIVGTPSYMAPEQALGHVHDIGPACDVYALGAILYECLTGRPPFNAATHLETLQQVQTQTPVAPSRLQPAVPRDLETICLKCLQKEPPRRYDSAQALADDLERFLTGQPIQARPAGRLERAAKWARRRPAVAALLATLALSVLAVIGILLWSNVRVRGEAAVAKKQSRRARQAVDDWYTYVAKEWLTDSAGMDDVQKELLVKALDYYKEMTQEGGSEPEVRREAARAHFRMGQFHGLLNHPAEAAADYDNAIALQEQLCRELPGERSYRQDLANSYNWRGELRREHLEKLKEAEEDFRTALSLQEQLRREAPEEADYRRELARSHSNLGLVKMDTNRRPDALRDYDEAVRLLGELVKQHAEDTGVRHELARTLTNRGVFHRENDQLAWAEEDFRRAIDELEELRRTGSARTTYAYNLAIVYQDLGNLRISQRHYGDALAPLRRAETILSRLDEDFPARTRYRKKLARTYLSLGSALAKIDEKGQAEKNWQKGQALLTDLVDKNPEEMEYQADLGRCLGNLGWLALGRDDLKAARPLLEKAVQHLGAAHGANPGRFDYARDLRSHCQSLAETLVRVGDRPKAVEAAFGLAAVFPERAQGYYYAACFVARCARLAAKDGSAREADGYAGQAADLLGQALDKGLKGDERLADEEQLLGPLAERPEYDELLRKLKARPRPAAAARRG